MEDASGLELTAQNVEATLDEIRWAAGLWLDRLISDQRLRSKCCAGFFSPTEPAGLDFRGVVCEQACCLLIAWFKVKESGLVLSLHCIFSLIPSSVVEAHNVNVCALCASLTPPACRPYLVGASGGGLELVELATPVVKVRITGPAAKVMTVRVAVTQKLREKIPSIAAVQLVN